MRLIDADEVLSEICRDQCERKYEDCDSTCAIAAYVTNAKTIGGWISVKDRLPMLYEDVLVYYVAKVSREAGMTITNMSDVLYFGANPIKVAPRWERPWQYFFENNEITHWMPLPESPKE